MPIKKMIHIIPYTANYFQALNALWQQAFPNDAEWNRADFAIPEKTRFQPDLLLVAIDGASVVGSVMAGYDGHRGWISRIAVLKSSRKQGIGKLLLEDAERRLVGMGCVKVNLQVVEANASVVEFYRACGYDIEPRISLSKILRRPDRS
ncbi:GNAT family acetyltransferase [Gemmobacter denitrificans]|uniref:GNAT family acetyltransferase n=1 Tax=Gemmobacter denitrificans TaxID=3123040 RepID=A0ABU8BWV1_9RHOB